jgi:uncharacterized DUF497 family protein
MDVAFSGFDWDDGYREKCRKHGVSLAEIESLFAGSFITSPDDLHSIDEQRIRAVGRLANGRHVFVVFMIRERDGKRLIRPISARFMHKKEVEHYEKRSSTPEANPKVQDR